MAADALSVLSLKALPPLLLNESGSDPISFKRDKAEVLVQGIPQNNHSAVPGVTAAVL
jgi:hypothetical protein